MGLQAHFISLDNSSLYERGKASLNTREGLDNKLISFRLLPFGLRPLAVILNCALFASLSRS